MKRIKILILDDEQGIRQEIGEFLRMAGFTVYEAQDPPAAFQVLKSNPIDIAIVDIRLPMMSGLEILEEIKKSYPHIEVIMISGHGDMDTVIEALRQGATDYLKKPFHLHEVMQSIEKTRKYAAFRDLLNKKLDIEPHISPMLWEKVGSPFIFGSSVMRNLYAQMVRVSVADSTTVLIIGESGTGKELVAHGIHLLSNRKEKPFQSVNCSSIPEELFESEFFGYKKGAFTGALQDKPGWFETAHMGTLFLDEIGDMKLSLQAKLLRIMDNQTVNRLGTTKTLKVDVRVIAATNHNIHAMVESERFRQDLYHRLNAFTITIPPLRERREDIPLLMNYYLNHYASIIGKDIKSYSTCVAEALDQYDFPGNVRELKHMIERAVILCDGPELTLDHFDHLRDHLMECHELGPSTTHNHNHTSRDIRQSEKVAIEQALLESGHNKSTAARMLGLSRQSLDRRMVKYGIG
jgi:DNA-binding NtrC family response regulator